MKAIYFGIISLFLILLVIGCKSKSQIGKDPNAVRMTLMQGITPSDLDNKSPFELLTSKSVNKTPNEYIVTYNLKSYTRSDLVNYLINLNGVISVDGIKKDVTPPIRSPKAGRDTKKQ